MSHYLATLVSRNAGLAPAVLSRPIDAGHGLDAPPAEPEVRDSDAVPLQTTPPQPAVVAGDTSVPAPSPPVMGVAPAPPLVPTLLPATATTIVQRLVMPAAPQAAPSTAPAVAAAPLSAAPVVRSTVERIITAPATPPLPAGGDPPVVDVERAPASEHAPSYHVAPRAGLPMPVAPTPEPHDVERGPDRSVETVRVVESPMVAGVPPSPAPLAATIVRPAPEPGLMPERVVHVRIGAIEIHGAPAAAATPPAPRPEAAPIGPPPESGFDRFARLRRYAAWEG